ncbi:hypothetical protein Bca52824_016449 [Brassica carinata]|uniref:MATH domain-containing protein n=1 Tax=Brassica carinata TaxID=52824 RepID=A0A8X7W4G7_BRACI|nr:hypothetical protein Bca52824_016449 [Brassica carinata]
MIFIRGYNHFIRRTQLETSEFLKDDCLIINCTVGVVVSEVQCPQLNSVRIPDSELGLHFGVLLDNMEGSDVTFDIAGEKFQAHKLVRITEGASLYSLCRSWLRKGAHEGVQKQQSDTRTCLSKPMPASDVVETSLPKDEPNSGEENKEDEESVKQLSNSHILKRHVDRAKKVHARNVVWFLENNDKQQLSDESQSKGEDELWLRK